MSVLPSIPPDELVRAAPREWSPVILIRACRKCGYAYPLEREFFYPSRGGFKWVCKECEKAAKRAKYAANAEEERRKGRESYARLKVERPEVYQARLAKVSARYERVKGTPRHREVQRTAGRRYREKLRRDPERAAALLEGRRMYETLRRRARGIPQRRGPSGTVVDRERVGRLPVGPLREALERAWAGSESDFDTFAESVGLHPRALRRVLREDERVSLDLADRVCTYLPESLMELYPELYEEAA